MRPMSQELSRWWTGFPVLLTANEDEVSRSIASFYEKAWKRDDKGELKAKADP